MFKNFLIFLIIFFMGIGFGSKLVKQNQSSNTQQEKNTVNNTNPDKDLYKDLGVGKEASKGAIG